MGPVYKVAVIQMHSETLRVEANFNKATSLIRAAANQGAQLAVLPEYHLTGWAPEDPSFKPICGSWSTYLDEYRKLAKECSINIVPGTLVELHDAGSESERLLNAAYFITNKGDLAGKYVKKNLWGPIERAHLTGSAREPHQVFDTPLGKVGLLICWDLSFPEAFRELIAQGAKLIIIPSFWLLNETSEGGRVVNPVAEKLFIDSLLTGRCFENTCGIIFANAGGPPAQSFIGLSQVCVPFAGPLARLDWAEGMLVVDLNMGVIEEGESSYKIRADLAREDWHYDYRHTLAK
ncbi:Carbon-nitrogen hydrolase [Penicillium concentricum]|uniref:Carbon-nitrogen hydrolase n=1 Tax=Penicillium concentricum TaxID=293559 RepID=A0A9W9SAV9_9EURO|nr:Carbon-nitrogen hydrolase [Penicillium concentricum]KAJ5375276.1 Carbon-nitrogen hydrolase [Penicillium concentricum]